MSERNPFWDRSEPPNPRRFEQQAREEEKRAKILREAPPTLFDLEQYFVDTNRGHFITNIGKLKKDLLNKELMRDLEQTDNPHERGRIRKLLLVAETGGFPRPEFNLDEIIKIIHGRIRSLHWEYMRRAEAGDETEIEEELLANWRHVALLLSQKQVFDDVQLSFIEDALREMQKNLEYNPQIRHIRDLYEKLRQVRNATYYRSF
jgi:hypothetical protein